MLIRSPAEVHAVVDGRELTDLDVCRSEGQRYLVSGSTGATIDVSPAAMTLTSVEGTNIATEKVTTTEDAATRVTAFVATFDRAAVGVGEVRVTVTGSPSRC